MSSDAEDPPRDSGAGASSSAADKDKDKLPKRPRPTDDSGSEGEEVARPSKKRPGMYSDESDLEDDEVDEEVTEEDKRFVVNDEDVEESNPSEDEEGAIGGSKRRRKRRGASDSDDDSAGTGEDDLLDDDLELIADNLGRKRRLNRRRAASRSPSPRRRAGRDSDEGEPADGDDDDEEGGSGRRERDRRRDRDRDRGDDDLQDAIFRERDDRMDEGEDFSDRDDMEDFIVDDEGGSGDEGAKAERRKRMREERSRMKDRAALSGVDESTYRMILDIFGDDSYYERIQGLRRKAAAAATNGRPLRVATNGEDDEMEEDEDIATPAVQNLKLTDIYEPTVLKERMLTENDEFIRQEDVPERFTLLAQDKNQPYAPAISEEELEEEAVYIANQLRSENLVPGANTEDAESKLAQVVRKLIWFMRGVEQPKEGEQRKGEQFLEVPFIATHRKDYWEPYLGRDSSILWRLFDLDLAYQARMGRQRELEALVSRVRQAAPAESVEDLVIDQLTDFIGTTEGVQDLRKYIYLHYGKALRRLDEEDGRDPVKATSTFYELARENGIANAAKHFHIDVGAFVHSCLSDHKYFFPEDDPVEPLAAMMDHVNQRYKDEKHVLNFSVKFLAEEIAAHPRFRAFVRQKFVDSAVVSVTPTAKGRDIISEEHEYFSFKYLERKPASAFRWGNFGLEADGMTPAQAPDVVKGQFALISRAAGEGLVTIAIDIDDMEAWTQKLDGYIASDNTSDIASDWNFRRKEILRLALHTATTDAAKWLKSKMLTEATEAICNESHAYLATKLTAAPFQRKKKEKRTRGRNRDSDSDSDSDDDDDEDPSRRDCRVAAISWGDGNRGEPTFAVTLDEDGLVQDHIQLYRMQDRGRDSSKTQIASMGSMEPSMQGAGISKQADLDRLADFLVNTRPDVVVVAAASVAAMRLFQDVLDVVERVRKSHIFLEHLEAHWILDDTALVWKNSADAKAEFRDYPDTLRYCIGLARKAQDPVMAYASLFNNDQDITKVRLNDKQSAAPMDLMVKHLERAMINAVAVVGVDINAALRFKHRSYTLRYVSGLGPRKAGFVLAKLGDVIANKRDDIPGLETRKDLIKERITGATVFFNCASFIRIRRYHFGSRGAYLDVLDDTRVHPDDYDIARQMATDAMDEDDLNDDDENPSHSVEELMASKESAAKLNELDLDGFADDLEKRVGQAKRLTLRDIKAELQNPFGDSRSLKQLYPSIADLFYMLTKESVKKFYPGCTVLATLRKKLGRVWLFELPGGLEGEMPPNDDSRIAEGAAMRVYIKDIKAQSWKDGIDISTMTETPRFEVYVDQRMVPATAVKDRFFLQGKQDEEERKRKEEQRRKMASQAAENISHPLYRRDLDAETSERELASKAVGDMLLRPSSKIGDIVAVVKTDENTYWHMHLVKNIQNGTLKWSIRDVPKVQFDDIDHLVTVYIDPIREKIKEMYKHPKFRPGKSLQETEGAVRQAALTNPNQASYAICSGGSKMPNGYYLVYKFPRTEQGPSHERIMLAPGSFTFRMDKRRTVDELILWFKKNPIAPAQGFQTGYQTARPPAMRPPGGGFTSYYAPQPGVPGSTWAGGPAAQTPYNAAMGMRPPAGGASYYGAMR